LKKPYGVAVDSNDNIIVTDAENHRVQVFTPEGIALDKYGGYELPLGPFSYPTGTSNIVVNIFRGRHPQESTPCD